MGLWEQAKESARRTIENSKKNSKQKSSLDIADNIRIDIFEFYFSKNYNFSPLLINYFEIDAAIKSAASISMFGWKKEAIPVTETKNSLITRIFKSLFG